jgi:hypothetical protein
MWSIDQGRRPKRGPKKRRLRRKGKNDHEEACALKRANGEDTVDFSLINNMFRAKWKMSLSIQHQIEAKQSMIEYYKGTRM